ncbi:GRAM domain-containing protein 1B [Papilio machaon]|uniref:GRAM domain-containing protein 1B n=1 Tax=Papilio machaon TaxID=76193 RepID=A0A0N1INS9_PAPMA|nr:GRAM domain-containing protein 1B [Papilio machaon]
MDVNVSEVDDFLLVDCEPSDMWNEVEEGCEVAQPAYVVWCQEPWQTQGTRKARRVSYTLSLSSGLVGPKKVRVNETQVMNKCSKPGALYSIDATSENSGIPYADYFTVEVHYCLQRAAETSTLLTVYAHVRYKKTMWPMVKSLLENNTMSGLEEYARLLEARLTAAQPAPARHARRRRRHLDKKTTQTVASTPGIPKRVPKGPPKGLVGARLTAAQPAPARHARRRRRHLAVTSQEPVAVPLVTRAARGGAAAGGGGARWLVLLVLALLLLNALLYWRLAALHNNTFDADELQARMRSVSGSQMADWSRLLQQHTSRQRSELLAWRDALVRTVAHLAQTEQELRKLLDTIKPSLEKAHAEADAVPPDGEL